mmetsp:Transcript_16295/g.23267  ORF Transcript_16295/g.23267 Transcript_16295/m.23267 type:complete len:274 (-) Transcript_16295:313-1134(-)
MSESFVPTEKNLLHGKSSSKIATERGSDVSSDRKRHGARNQNRHKLFIRWILERFEHVLSTSAQQQGDGDTSSNVYILEIAGGKGELAARLSVCHKIRVVICDPRPADVASCFEDTVFKTLPKKWQQGYMQKSSANPKFIHEQVDQYVDQLVMNFDENAVRKCARLEETIKNAALLIGMHADGATEDIVNVALRYGKPFVVVPCCVFPNSFLHRRLVVNDGREIPVRTHDQFCSYLHKKDVRFLMETLPFEGRNVAIWWGGTESQDAHSQRPC